MLNDFGILRALNLADLNRGITYTVGKRWRYIYLVDRVGTDLLVSPT